MKRSHDFESTTPGGSADIPKDSSSCDICGKIFGGSEVPPHHQEHRKMDDCENCAKLAEDIKKPKKAYDFKDILSLSQSTSERSAGTPESIYFVCHYCQSSFEELDGIDMHGYIHAEEKQHLCAICDFSFRSRACLVRHLKALHKREKKEKITIANIEKEMATKANIEKEKVTSTNVDKEKGIRANIGKIDGKAQKTSDSAGSSKSGPGHMCCICEKLFVDMLRLKTHSFSHIINGFHHCGVCGLKYNCREGLEYHFKNKHDK